MKTVLTIACVLVLYGSAVARLGDTRDAAEARYGLPKSEKPPQGRGALIEGAKELTFEYQGWKIRCVLLPATDGKEYIVREEYRKIWNGEVMKKGGVISIRDFERDAVLTAEGGLQRWSKRIIDTGNDKAADLSTQFANAFISQGRTFIRDDGALARLMPFSSDALTLDLPQALRYEAELRAIKDQKARTEASRLYSSNAPAPAPATPAPAPKLRSFTTPAPVVEARQSPIVAAKTVDPTPETATVTPEATPAPPVFHAPKGKKEDAPEPPLWFIILTLGLILCGLAFVGYLIVVVCRRILGIRGNKPAVHEKVLAGVSAPPPLPELYPTPTESRRTRTFKDLGWDEFEMLVGEIYRRKGYQVEISGGTGADGGVDLVLRRDEEQILVQCKNWNASKVTAREIREFFGVLVSEGATRGIFVTAGQYTRDAREFADGKPIEMIDGDGLSVLAAEAQNDPDDDLLNISLWAPFFAQAAIITDPLCPFCRARMVRRNGSRGEFWGCSTFPRCRGKREVRRYLTPLGAM